MTIIEPGRTIGVLGGGQLGRMLALEAKRMGYRVITLDPEPDSPCGQVADAQIVAPYDDLEAVARLGDRSDVVTYEFENVPATSVQRLEAEGRWVRPSSAVLAITQNRWREKTFVSDLGIGVPAFRAIASIEDGERAAREIGFPAVLKTISGGYDGKGQALVRTLEEARDALHRLGVPETSRAEPQALWEQWVPFAKEVSMIGVRDERGTVLTYPLVENVHVDNILDTSIVPARVAPSVEEEARRIVRAIGEHLQIIGVYCVEMFLLEDDRLLVNEIAPRPHNSGHYTLDACMVSQFENHARAICGLPIVPPILRSPAVMINLLGDGRGHRLIGVERILEDPRVRLHLYGKKEARPKRKMGHVTVLAEEVTQALELAHRVRQQLRWG
ncbi:MAG: 5-(carboxyamino)imidazole ribonucleotide synthase [Blastocatellia bacterium]|nr:5-(carboxyamino)imidazole ribonucleotide synthase [Blastocatellia bacterium]